MAIRPEDLQALEEVWRKRVESARERYLAAVSQGDLELKREARADYMRVLRVFAELTLKGKMPPEDG
jgi:hypothetical protein